MRHKKISILVIAAIALSSAAFSSAVMADTYQSARAELLAAFQQQDYPGMVNAAIRALAIRPGNPGAGFNLAMARALNGEHQASLQTLTTLLEQGVDFGADELEQFAAVRKLDEWSAYQEKLAALHEPVGSAEVYARYADSRFVPEGIAIDDRGSILLGSIHRGQLIQIGEKSAILSERNSHWSVFGMRLHPDGSIWFASAAVPQLADVGEDGGATGLFRFDRETAEITKIAILPAYEATQVLGDLTIADANTIYASDSLTGAIYRYYIDSNEFEILVKRGELVSPQGLVLDENGEYLYVADYATGLFRVSLADGSLLKLQLDAGTTDYGIDGLYRFENELIAIQNGIRPHRISAFELDQRGLAIVSARTLASNLKWFDEPTLGTIVDTDFFFTANSHWNRFDQENRLQDGLSGPIILKLPLH